MVERKTGVPDSLPATKPGVRTYQEAERLLFLCLAFVNKDKARAWSSSAYKKHPAFQRGAFASKPWQSLHLVRLADGFAVDAAIGFRFRIG